MAQLAFALTAYKNREGAYPQQLEQLVPDFLPEVPHDRFTEAPLFYQANASGYLAYSVGKDGEDNTRVGEDTYLGDETINGRSNNDIQLHYRWEEEEEAAAAH